MKRKLLSIFMCVSMLSLVGCGNSQTAGSSVTTENTESITMEESGTEATREAGETELVAEGSDVITVTDQNGMTVALPGDLDRVVTTALPLPSVYALTGAPIENLVGVHPGSASAIENSVMAAMYPELSGIANNFIEGTDINVEELLKLEPDVVLYWAEYLEQYKAMDNAGIRAVGVKTQANGDVLTTLESWLEIMKEMFGDTGNVDKVIDYGREMEAEIAEQTKNLTEEEKPKVLYLYNHSSEDISVSGADFYGDYWIKAGGGVNAAAELTGPTSVNMEQIYEWNPDIILITTFTESMPQDLYNNTIDGQDWSQVNAVLNGKVYKEPLGVYRWFPPSGDAPLMLKWMAQTLHPEIFTYDMKNEIRDYYKEFYNYSLEEDQIEGILTANPEAAKGANFGGSSGKS